MAWNPGYKAIRAAGQNRSEGGSKAIWKNDRPSYQGGGAPDRVTPQEAGSSSNFFLSDKDVIAKRDKENFNYSQGDLGTAQSVMKDGRSVNKAAASANDTLDPEYLAIRDRAREQQAANHFQERQLSAEEFAGLSQKQQNAVLANTALFRNQKDEDATGDLLEALGKPLDSYTRKEDPKTFISWEDVLGMEDESELEAPSWAKELGTAYTDRVEGDSDLSSLFVKADNLVKMEPERVDMRYNMLHALADPSSGVLEDGDLASLWVSDFTAETEGIPMTQILKEWQDVQKQYEGSNIDFTAINERFGLGG